MFKTLLIGAVAVGSVAIAMPAQAGDCENSAAIGSGGSAAAGGTSASTLGTGAACDTGDGSNATIGSGGSAAAVDGKTKSQTKTNVNKNNLQSRSKAQAMDKGTFSKSHTKTKIRHGDELQSSTKTMAHVPGEKPVMNKTGVETEVPNQ